MIFQALAWVMLAGLAQPWAPSSPALPEAPPPVFRIITVEASNDGHEESSLDDEAAGLREMLKDLPFDTFRVVAKDEQAAPLGIDTVIPISGEYRFHVTPSAYRPDSGEVELSARIEMLENHRAVNALAADGVAVPGKALVFRGFPLNGREMAVIMTVVPPEKEQGPSPGEDENQAPQEQPQPAVSEEPAAEQEETGEPQSADAGASEEDHENVEALLQSLEEIDRREQQEVRKRRNRVEVRKEWW